MYLKVETLTGFHIIKIENIVSISPKSGEKIQTQIKTVEANETHLYYTTESQEKVFEKLNKKEQSCKIYHLQSYNRSF